MAPLIPFALALAKEFLPSLVGKIAGDKSGEVAGKVIDAAAELTGIRATDKDTLDQVINTLSAKPDLLVQFQTRLAELKLETLQAYLGDRQDARQRDVELTKSGKVNWRADAMVLTAFVALTVISVTLIVTKGIEQGVLAFLTTIGGMLMKNISTAFDFEFGSSRGSKGKSEDSSRLLERLVSLKRGE